MASSDNNNMEIELYRPSQVGETDAANPTNAENPTNSTTANSANAAELSTTISDNENADADSTTGWKWKWPKVRNPAGKKASILLDVKTDVIQDINNRLGKQTLERFRESCFGAYLHYPRSQVPATVMHLMLRQQVIKEGADEDELWFLVGDTFVRFSKYEYALVTGLRFGPTNFDPNADNEIRKDGVYRKFIDPHNKFSKKGAKYTFVLNLFNNPPKELRRSKERESLLKIAKVLFVHGFLVAIDTKYRIANWVWSLVENENEWETFPWGAYSFQILMYRMKNAKVKAGDKDNYHIYGFSHAFLHFIFESVPGLADILTSKPKHKCVQPRLLKRQCHTKLMKEYLNFFDSQDIQCFEKLEPTKQELIDYTWWHHVADDVRSSVRYIHRESNKAKKALLLKRTREQSPVPEQGQGDGSVPEVELRPQKKGRTTESPNVYSGELLTRILEGVRRENELCVQRVMREVSEIQEMGSRKADDMRSEIEGLRKTLEELRRHKNYASFEEDYVAFEKQPPPSPTEQTPPPLLPQKTPAPPPKKITPPPPAPTDDAYVPFDGDFVDDIIAFSDKQDYVRHRSITEPRLTPIKGISVEPGDYLTPIKAIKHLVIKQKSETSALNIRRAIRPPRDSDGTTSYPTNKHMIAYQAYLDSDPKEKRNVGHGMSFENASFFKRIEDPAEWMETPAIDAYLRILHLSPEFVGCHPEGKGKFLVLGSYFCESMLSLSRNMYHENKAIKILDEDKGQMEKLDPKDEFVKQLLDHVLGKPILYTTENWAPLIPFTEVDKIYVVWLAHQHFYPLVIDLVKCEVWVIDSLANNNDEDTRLARYEGTLCLRRILPALLQLSGFYDVRKDLKPVNREWDLRFANKEQCFLQTDKVSCGPFSCKMMEVLVSRRALPNITQENMKFIRRGIAERIFSFSKPAPKE
ncbi:hypothetical protein CASFOL_041552 [Castilleja foliolosa]|uniref:Ubiquitin-like protease family profile domain-containing protein n=1 Tax=Castilleja foliolosa TaxID=1961234 RepID=A0ABD3BAQ9_9LAMI